MGSALLPCMKKGMIPEEVNLAEPERVTDIHRAFIEAGADLIETNTFGANRIKLEQTGKAHLTEKLNLAGVCCARNASSGRKAFVAGSIGPSGIVIRDENSFWTVYHSYMEQAGLLAQAGVDCLILETFSDLKEIKIAVAACSELRIPCLAQVTLDGSGRMLSGTDAETAAQVLSAQPVTGIGINCSLGAQGILPLLTRMAERSSGVFLSVFPNAGLPQLDENGGTVYYEPAEEFSKVAESYYQLGANIIGGCCGTGFEHIRSLSAKLSGKAPKPRNTRVFTSVCSRSKTVFYADWDMPPLLIGERLNPTGRKKLGTGLRKSDYSLYRNEALLQAQAGATALDLNVSVSGIDEKKTLLEAIAVLQNCCELPLCIDSSSPEVLAAVLPFLDGKPVVNSINGREDTMEVLLPALRKWGATAIVLPIDENGIPATPEARLRVAEKVLAAAEKYGISRNRLLFDGLTLTLATDQAAALTGIETIRRMSEEKGLLTSMGVSNVSYGLPARSSINAAFLTQLIHIGVAAVIINPFDDRMMDAFYASCALSGRVKGFTALQEREQRQTAIKQVSENKSGTAEQKSESERLKDAVLSGSLQEALDLTSGLL
ncbi:MAG: homocysteine S-methyltransferase family protein, partial [Candidatus Wallbacteria bacterium]|nr:homocysteine S-methyltransferase family protein [Candidatus Wallbacteria bacterium]